MYLDYHYLLSKAAVLRLHLLLHVLGALHETVRQ